MGFLELRRQYGVSHEVRWGAQGASHVVPGSQIFMRGARGRSVALSLPSSDPGLPGLGAEPPLDFVLLSSTPTFLQSSTKLKFLTCRPSNRGSAKRGAASPISSLPPKLLPTNSPFTQHLPCSLATSRLMLSGCILTFRTGMTCFPWRL